MLRAERAAGLIRAPLLFWRLAAEGRYDFSYDQMPIRCRGMSLRKRANLLRSGLNLVFRRAMPWSWPLHMQFELANYCNLRCPVCPTGVRDLQRPAKAMPPELFERVMSEVGPYLLTASLWGWGESLLNPHLAEILAIARRYPVVTLLSTNGQNLDRDSIVEAILAAPPCYLIVAIDGLTDETNSRFRVGARLAPALEGVRRIAALKRERKLRLPILHMRFIVMRHNEHELEDAPVFAARHGFDMFTSRKLSIVESGPARQAHPDLMPGIEQFRAGRLQESRKDFLCMQAFWYPSLYADGTVVLCEQDSAATAPAGVVGPGSSFGEAWRSARAAAIRRTIRDTPSEFSFCENCPACDRASTDSSVVARFFTPGLADPLVVDG